MGHYSEHAYGIDVSHVFNDLSEEAQEGFDRGRWGATQYDGGGYGQITYLGVEVTATKRGIIVTPEIEGKTAKVYAIIPDAVRREICASLLAEGRDPEGTRYSDEAMARLAQGILPEPEFLVMSGWG